MEAVETSPSATPTCPKRYGNRAHRAINKGDFVLVLDAVGDDVMDDGRRRERGEVIKRWICLRASCHMLLVLLLLLLFSNSSSAPPAFLYCPLRASRCSSFPGVHFYLGHVDALAMRFVALGHQRYSSPAGSRRQPQGTPAQQYSSS